MSIESLVKQPAEARLYSMDFRNLLGSGENISAINSVDISPVTTPPLVGGPCVFSGAVAQLKLSGGTDGTAYKVTIVAATDAGNVVEGEAVLQVRDL